MSLLGDFERIIILNTLLHDIDRNFLTKQDLEKIRDIGYDMEIKNFPKYDLDDLYNYDNRIELVYEKYIEFGNDEYLKIKREIENLIGGN